MPFLHRLVRWCCTLQPQSETCQTCPRYMLAGIREEETFYKYAACTCILWPCQGYVCRGRTSFHLQGDKCGTNSPHTQLARRLQRVNLTIFTFRPSLLHPTTTCILCQNRWQVAAVAARDWATVKASSTIQHFAGPTSSVYQSINLAVD